MAGEQRWQDAHAVAVGVRQMIVESGGAAVETFGDDARCSAKFGLQHARPTVLVGVAVKSGGVIAPGERVAVTKDRLHPTFQFMWVGDRSAEPATAAAPA